MKEPSWWSVGVSVHCGKSRWLCFPLCAILASDGHVEAVESNC